MKILKKQFLILLTTFWLQNSSSFLTDLFNIAKAGWTFVGKLRELKGDKDALIEFSSLIFGKTDENAEVLQKLDSIQKDLQDFQTYTRNKLDWLEVLINALPAENQVRVMKRMIALEISLMDKQWDKFMDNIARKAEPCIFNDSALDVISNTETSINKIRQLITPQVVITASDGGFFKLMKDVAVAKMDTLCGEGETYHHTLVHVLQLLFLTEIKALVMIDFSYHWRYSIGDAWKVPAEKLKNDFQKHLKLYIHEFSTTLESSKLPFIRTCDPRNGNWIRGETFFELEKFLQQTIYRGTQCYENDVCAAEAWSPDQLYDWCKLRKLSDHTACDNQILDCQPFKSRTHKNKVCAYSDGPYRIKWIKSHSKGVRGIKYPECPSTNLWVNRGIIWSRPSNAFCNCQCYTPFWKVVTEITVESANTDRIIVGMRLNVYRDVIYIQPAVAELRSHGNISNFRWMQAEEYLRRNLMFITVTLTENSFFFDDVQLPSGYLLTQVSFDYQTRNGITGFGLKISGVPFNYETGTSDSTRKVTITNEKRDSDRELSFRSRSSIHMTPYAAHRLDSNGYTHLKLKQSEIYHDFGQSTLPLFDSTHILTSPLSPIGGVGIIHKGYEEYAGFLSLRLYPIDYLHFVRSFLQMHDLNNPSAWIQ